MTKTRDLNTEVSADTLHGGITREELRLLLSQNAMELEVLKKDGSPRLFYCTTDPSRIPLDKRPKPLSEGAVPAERDPDLIPVYDLEAQGWRSFRYSRLQTVGT
jgi:hypothetical protein